jgi:sulfatase modifying factor 1
MPMANRLLLLGSLLVASAAAGAALHLVARPPRPPVAPAAPPPSPEPAPPAPAAEPGAVHPAVALAAPEPARAAEPPPPEDETPRTLVEQRAALFRLMRAELDLSPEQLAGVERLFAASPFLGQGNPAVSRHPMTPAECRAVRARAGLVSEPHPPCARRSMVPLYDPGAGETAADAKVCIDQFEFPDVACAYPVVNASAREAAELCAAVGKRICDAHEWEGACAGALHAPEVEYEFGKPRPYATWLHNKAREVRWAYGPAKDHALCGTASAKTPGCEGGRWSTCGTNTYPAGAFPACVSPFGVYDQHGNAAEHMNLPLAPEELASRGGTGATEMKGSWFIFQTQEPHEDDCRWRAKDWHPSRLMDVESHRNYHLGLRCCEDVTPPSDAGAKP